MDSDDVFSVSASLHHKKRKLSALMNCNNENTSSVPAGTPLSFHSPLCGDGKQEPRQTTPGTVTGMGHGRQFLSVPGSNNVFQTEEWRSSSGSALFLPVSSDLMVNVARVEQITCEDGTYFVADHCGNYSTTLTGKVIHLWRYDKHQHKLYISRSFLFTNIQEYLSVQQFLQHI